MISSNKVNILKGFGLSGAGTLVVLLIYSFVNTRLKASETEVSP